MSEVDVKLRVVSSRYFLSLSATLALHDSKDNSSFFQKITLIDSIKYLAHALIETYAEVKSGIFSVTRL
jgi:hypothetical protein